MRYGFTATNGYGIALSEDEFQGLDLEKTDGGRMTCGVFYGHLDVFWRYFEDPEAALAEGNIEPWKREEASASSPGSFDTGFVVRAVSRGKTIEEVVFEEVVDAVRDLHDWLDGQPAWTIWTHRPTAVARALLAVGNSPEQVDAIWSDAPQRARWIERAKAALTHVDQHFR